MSDVSLEIKDLFFDREAVITQIGQENARKLSKAGAFLRKRGRSKLRRRKKSAKAGQAPSVHSRDSHATLKNILFGLDPSGESVLVGPVGIPSRKLRGSSARTVAELMEQGGTAIVDGKRANFNAHPFMAPTLEEETAAGTIADIFKG